MGNLRNIFELSEVAELLHLPASRVKNWTIGRPLTITPSVRPASGTGSRNLYSTDDVYLFALAEDLNEFGLVPRITQQVLDRARGKVAQEMALFIAGTVEKPRIELHRVEPCKKSGLGHIGYPCIFCKKETAANLSLDLLEQWKQGAYLRDLGGLVTRVNKDIDKSLRRG